MFTRWLSLVLAVAWLGLSVPALAVDIDLKQSDGTKTPLGGTGDSAHVTITGGAGAGGSGCMPTAADASYAEAVANYLSCTLAGWLRVSVEAFNIILSCEDQDNTLCMVSGGPVRYFPIMTAVTTNSTSTTAIVHSGGKTPMASVTGTGALVAVVDFYGDMENTTTHGTWLCTVSLSGTTKAVKSCLTQIVKDYPYYHAVLTGLTGTGATVEAGMAVGIAGVSNNEYFTSAVVASDTQVKATAGFLQCIIISQNDAAPTAGTIVVYDSAAESGTIIFNWTLTTAVFVPFQICPQHPMNTGIYIGFTTTADVNVGVTYR